MVFCCLRFLFACDCWYGRWLCLVVFGSATTFGFVVCTCLFSFGLLWIVVGLGCLWADCCFCCVLLAMILTVGLVFDGLFLYSSAGCVGLVVSGFCCSGLFLAGVHADVGVWFWCFGVLVGVDCCVSGSLLILVFATCGWVWCLTVVVVWLWWFAQIYCVRCWHGLFRFVI